jgi:hypothetical protein
MTSMTSPRSGNSPPGIIILRKGPRSRSDRSSSFSKILKCVSFCVLSQKMYCAQNYLYKL